MIIFIVFIVLLTFTNVLLLTKYAKYKQRYKQRGLFGPWPVPQTSLDQLDPVFKTNELGPTLDTLVQFVGRGNLNVPGGTSDTEGWVLSVLGKKSKNIFEFGTCTGKTAYLFAKNSLPEAKVTTITLGPDQLAEYQRGNDDDTKSTTDAIEESAFTKFLYSGTPEEKKITQLFGDSKHFDETPYRGKMDLIFIDGSHAYSYVLSDSEKAFNMIAPGGIILWHDYRGPNDTVDVYKALNKIGTERKLVHIKDTSLVAYRA